MRLLPIKRTLLLAALLLSWAGTCLGQCPTSTTKGNDFWVAFLYNQDPNGPSSTDMLQIHGVLDGAGTLYYYDTAGVEHVMPVYDNTAGCCFTVGANAMRVATPFNGACHITSTTNIWLYARNVVEGSDETAMVVPTQQLGSRYIVQDYPANQKGGEVAFVATQDNTVLSMTVPCNIWSTNITAGTTLNVNLNSGQAYLLIADDCTGSGTASFSGMEVTSNNKPFAMFQGGWNPTVPTDSTGGDHLFEQAIPPNCWGTEFIVAGVAQQAVENRVRITAAEGNCSVSIDGATVATLAANATYEYTMIPSSEVRISTSKQASVILYLGSGGNTGAPSSVTIPPLDAGVCESGILKPTSNEIFNMSMIVICRQDYDSGMRLNDNPLPTAGTSIVGNYVVHRINSIRSSYDYMHNAMGPYVAYCYGLGEGISYAYPLGMVLEPRSYDTVVLYDNACEGAGYHNNGFNISADGTMVGTMTLERDDTLQHMFTHYVVHLTVWPTQYTILNDSIVLGDTMVWNGITIYDEGEYTATLLSEYGCDSLVTLRVSFTGFDTIRLYDTACAGSHYEMNGFVTELPDTTGEVTLQRHAVEDGTPRLYILRLTVLPLTYSDLNFTIVDGDTMSYGDTLLSTVGDYEFRLTGANGCDSIVRVHLRYAELGLTASASGVCPGEEVTITASGTYTYIWSSMPYDAELDSLQGQNPIAVHPRVTTEYRLLDGTGETVGRVTIGAEEPPVLCVEASREFVDFDHPGVIFKDCSEGRHHTRWLFGDGDSATGERVLHEFAKGLEDSVEVTLSTCNRYDCCVDTTLVLAYRIRSVWFPNVFTPDGNANNRFRCLTSRELESFEMDIYDRWGMHIWGTTDVQQGWDGRRTDGTPCRQGAYVYRFVWRDVDGETKSGIGTVTLLR
ncbi:MAG: gliding motility-associated C-terminal domain-containing protein [Bacteroidales bacterium]|nr:gliding motility-associated C-terminal domain-containing protein [Bacteroidales bacterium]